MTNIEFYNLPAAVAAAMAADMDAAAAEFWAYPDQEWQLRFEAQWLRERGYVHEAEKAIASMV